MIRVLVADDDPNTRYLLEFFCRDKPELDLEFVTNGQLALKRVNTGEVDVVVADIRMPKMSGDELLSEIKRTQPRVPVVIMTSYGSIEDAVDFLQKGADDYLAKPLTRDAFLHRLERVTERVSLSHEIERLRAETGDKSGPRLIGDSRQIRELKDRLQTIAETGASVVIGGESGTGKEVVARRVHALSKRSSKPFVTVNCGSIPENLLESELFGYKQGAFTGATKDTPGLVEEANTGTLFLDEIGEMALNVQVKLLRFLQLKEYKPLGSPKSVIADVRIIAATNRDLKQAVADGTFREDLYYRLHIIPIELPPLRERVGDIALLARFFLDRFNQRLGREVVMRDPDVLALLERHPWPGNVRELENKIEQLAVLAENGEIRAESVRLDSNTVEPARRGDADIVPYKEAKRAVLDRFERSYLERLLKAEGGRVTDAAKRAGLDRKNLWQLMQRHKLNAADYKARSRSRSRPR